MTAKIFRGIFITAMVVLFVALSITFAFTYNSYIDLALDEIKRECEYVKVGYDEYGEGYLLELGVSGSRITHISRDGTVLYDSVLTGENLTVENHSNREEFREALKTGEGVARRRSESVGRQMVYCAMTLEDGSVMRVSSEYFSVGVMLGRMTAPVLVMLFAVLAFAFFVAVRLSGKIVRPINELNLECPESAGVYVELRPIINKITWQNYKISKQMAELQLRQNEFDSITSNMSEGMVVINSVGDILSANKSGSEILDCSGSIPRSVLALDISEGFRRAIVEALGGKTGVESMSRDGKHYSIIATPVRQDGRVDGAVIVMIDDTEKESREELRREFTSNISHELKTPLTSISGFAELIRDGIAGGEDARRFAGNIFSEAQRLVTLVGDIIRLTQLDGGEVPYDGEVSLLDICREVAERIAIVAAKKNISIIIDEKSDSGMVLGNRYILEEIVYNLVDNGIKYNNDSGYVKLSVQTEDGQTRLSVSDNGIGIPNAHKDRVFERFYRVDKSHSRNIGGTGLGLSIVKHAAMYHKAQILLESELGKGTEVSIIFHSANS